MIKKIWPWVVLLAVIFSWDSVSANDGSNIFFEGESGGYHITLSVQPEVIAVGEVHFSITVAESDSMLPVTDAEIVLLAIDQNEEPTYQVRALNTPNDPVHYMSNIKFESPGDWILRVKIGGRLGDTGLDVPLFIKQPALMPASEGTILFFGILVVLLTGSLYLWRSSRSSLKSRNF
tara:strand:+ start:193 stop:723 length:531 start_codon:yes stop_codon:yes gene_type:complete